MMSYSEFQTQFIHSQPLLWLALAALLGLLIGIQFGIRIGLSRGRRQETAEAVTTSAQTLDEVIAEEQQNNAMPVVDEMIEAVDIDQTAPSTAVTKVDQLVGVNPKHLEKLSAHGISTIEQLVEATGSRSARESLADELQLEDFVVNKWARMAAFLQLPNMSAQVAEFLVFAGINSPHDLAQSNPESLFHKLQNLNEKEQRIAQLPARQQFEQWHSQLAES